jgi:hypothetical protein
MVGPADRRSPARAYFLSHSLDAENLVRAETTIDELVRELGASTDPLKVRNPRALSTCMRTLTCVYARPGRGRGPDGALDAVQHP